MGNSFVKILTLGLFGVLGFWLLSTPAMYLMSSEIAEDAAIDALEVPSGQPVPQPPSTDDASASTFQVADGAINPRRPFGIELGAPFPSNVTYGSTYEAFDVIMYEHVDVPEPHIYFNQPQDDQPDPYWVNVSARTGEVMMVQAMTSAGEYGGGIYGTPYMTCEQALELHDEMRDGAGLLSIPRHGRPAGWHGIDDETFWQANLADRVDENGDPIWLEVYVGCSVATWKVEIIVTDNEVYRRHMSAE